VPICLLVIIYVPGRFLGAPRINLTSQEETVPSLQGGFDAKIKKQRKRKREKDRAGNNDVDGRQMSDSGRSGI